MNKTLPCRILAAAALFVISLSPALAAEQWDVFETSFTSARKYDNPFLDVQVDAVFRSGKQQWLVPAFWAGGDQWTVRFAPPVPGDYTFQVKCSDPANQMVNGASQALHVTAYTGDNPLLKHGFVRVAADKRHFEHADGTPFFWLGDTWWKCLCKRMTWDGFQELTADRRAKGFNVVQIVCGPYPDEGFLEPRLANEGGLPYESVKFEKVNPKYFDYAEENLYLLCNPAVATPGLQLMTAEDLNRYWRSDHYGELSKGVLSRPTIVIDQP